MDADPHLSPEQQRALQEARDRAKGIMAAAKVAGFNGWTVGVFAGLTVLFGLTSPVLIALGAGMAVVARNEFRGRSLVRRLDPAGPRLLTRNQIAFMALVVSYCTWSLLRTYTHPDPQWAQLQELAGFEEGFVRDLVAAAYGAAILLTVLFVGLNARYYFRRVAMLEEYLASTPGWVVELQRSASVD
ncbi:MAG: hypothetical protein Q8N53_13090 [Longimicrobiales bacterium]|nr:hypothetical protein [Longimicrobiales bacterium]